MHIGAWMLRLLVMKNSFEIFHLLTGPYCEKVKEYCDIVEDPPACKNGGICTSLREHYVCECMPGFTGKFCLRIKIKYTQEEGYE